MADPLTPSVENKLNDLNKKIAEIKKKIQLSEGQRKANFEEYEAKKHEYAEKIATLKRTVKQLYAEYARTKHTERGIHASRESSACGRKRNLGETIGKVQEDNVRLRKRHDLIKYQREKRRQKLSSLSEEYDQLVNDKMQKMFKRKTEHPLRNKIVQLEVRLEHVRMMQIKANITRMKYRSARAELKEKSVLYASSLKSLEDEIREEESEIKRLQARDEGVREEAIKLKDNTQGTLIKEEIEVTNCSKERNAVLEEYRQRVLERKTELERLEKMIFHSRPREDFDTRGKSRVQAAEDITKDEVTRLEEAFAKLRGATGVSRSEDVLNRFLGQRATKDNLQKMRVATEQEKMALEKQRQEFVAEMEARKFSETKNAEQNAEEVEQLNSGIEEQRSRQLKAEQGRRRVEDLLRDVTGTLWNLCKKFQDILDHLPEDPNEIQNPLHLVELMNEKVKTVIESLGGPDKYLEVLNEIIVDKLETLSITTTSVEGKAVLTNGGQLFSRFPSSATPATIPSEDEEDVPTRNVLKKQAQQLVDVKSRRKGFIFRR
ncbi:outer dynein arm-docking complex subunit 3-like [Andrena cerasifolii]|uniref:outer dynein arm-docking complex subunit 3-like n=1 Tax=Andrena cerasifolii TaxID=2819439 RepID=UPI004038252E